MSFVESEKENLAAGDFKANLFETFKKNGLLDGLKVSLF
jgi:hypothetical protein